MTRWTITNWFFQSCWQHPDMLVVSHKRHYDILNNFGAKFKFKCIYNIMNNFCWMVITVWWLYLSHELYNKISFCYDVCNKSQKHEKLCQKFGAKSEDKSKITYSEIIYIPNETISKSNVIKIWIALNFFMGKFFNKFYYTEYSMLQWKTIYRVLRHMKLWQFTKVNGVSSAKICARWRLCFFFNDHFVMWLSHSIF